MTWFKSLGILREEAWSCMKAKLKHTTETNDQEKLGIDQAVRQE